MIYELQFKNSLKIGNVFMQYNNPVRNSRGKNP
jgi:hypothetical protein